MGRRSELSQLVVEGRAGIIAAKLNQSLQETGLEVTITFDLENACAPLSEPCPHHEGEPCSCHLILLTVRGFPVLSPRLIRIHSDDDQAIVQLDPAMVEEERQFIHTVVRAALSL